MSDLSDRSPFRTLATTLAVLAVAATPLVAQQGQSGNQRPLSDWLGAQGSFLAPWIPGGLFVPPAPNFLGWYPGDEPPIVPQTFAAIDYAGLAHQTIVAMSGGTIDLGTTVSGSVSEHAMSNGRARITVTVHARIALTWATSDQNNVATGPLLFGNRVTDVLAGAPPSLGDCTLRVVYINPAPGAPLGDLIQVAFFPEAGQQLLSLSIHATSSGQLRSAFGVPDGTPGRCTIVQTGVYHTSGGGNTADSWPAESIRLQPVGH